MEPRYPKPPPPPPPPPTQDDFDSRGVVNVSIGITDPSSALSSLPAAGKDKVSANVPLTSALAPTTLESPARVFDAATTPSESAVSAGFLPGSSLIAHRSPVFTPTEIRPGFAPMDIRSGLAATDIQPGLAPMDIPADVAAVEIPQLLLATPEEDWELYKAEFNSQYVSDQDVPREERDLSPNIHKKKKTEKHRRSLVGKVKDFFQSDDSEDDEAAEGKSGKEKATFKRFSLRSSKRSSKSKTPELKLPLTAVESTSPAPPADKTSMSTTMTTKTTTARVREKGFKVDGSPH